MLARLLRALKLLRRALRLSDHPDAKRNLEDTREYLRKVREAEEAKSSKSADTEAERKQRRKKRRRAAAGGEDAEADKPTASDDDVYDKPAKRRPQRVTPVDSSTAAAVKAKAAKAKPAMDRPRRENKTKRDPLPRIHVAHLEWKENEQYAKGLSDTQLSN